MRAKKNWRWCRIFYQNSIKKRQKTKEKRERTKKTKKTKKEKENVKMKSGQQLKPTAAKQYDAKINLIQDEI